MMVLIQKGKFNRISMIQMMKLMQVNNSLKIIIKMILNKKNWLIKIKKAKNKTMKMKRKIKIKIFSKQLKISKYITLIFLSSI